LFQACHGSKHGWITLAQICDFARVLATAPNVNCLGLLDDARRAGSLRMLLLGVELAQLAQPVRGAPELVDAARHKSTDAYSANE
jgi:Uncharacterised nucleotidyltransferase